MKYNSQAVDAFMRRTSHYSKDFLIMIILLLLLWRWRDAGERDQGVRQCQRTHADRGHRRDGDGRHHSGPRCPSGPSLLDQVYPRSHALRIVGELISFIIRIHIEKRFHPGESDIKWNKTNLVEAIKGMRKLND